MKRWWLVMALMLSVGINLGLVVSWMMPTRSVPEVAPEQPKPEPSVPEVDALVQADRPLPRIFFRMAEDLGLEGESKGQFMSLQRRFLRRTISARSQLQESQTHLRREMIAVEPRREVISGYLDQMAEARGELETAFVDNVLDTREILEPAQVRRFIQMIGRLRQSREQFRRGPQRSGPQRPGQQRPPFQPRRPGPRPPS